jgi:hypothetical protein
MLAFTNYRLILFPDLFPGLVFASPLFSGHHRSINTKPKSGHKKKVVSFMHQAGKHTPGEQGGLEGVHPARPCVHRSPFPNLTR